MGEKRVTAAGFGGALFLIATFALILLAFTLSFIFGLVKADADSTVYYILNYSLSPIALFGTLFFATKMSNGRFFTLTAVKKFDPAYLIPAVILPFAVLFGFGTLNELIEDLGLKIGLNIPERRLPLNGVTEYLLFTFFICVLPAVAEELFFRGALTNYLSRCAPLVAAFLSELCFALYHLSLFSFVYQFIFGVILAILRWRAKSVIPCVLAHFLNNFVNLSIIYFDIAVNFYSPILIISGVAVTLGIIIFIVLYKKETPEKPTEKAKDFLIPYGLFAMLIAIAVSVVSAVVK